MQSRVIIILIFTIILVMFAVVNIETVLVNFIFFEAEIKLIYIIIFSILFGALSIYFISANTQRKLNKKIKLLENDNKRMKQEIEQSSVHINTND